MSGGIVTFHRVLDVFDGKADSWCCEHQRGTPLHAYLPKLRGKRNPFHCYVRRADGERIVDPESYTPEPGDAISLREVPGAPGILVIALVLAAGSYLVQRLTMPKIPRADFGTPDGPSQSFGGIQSISTGGVPLPLCYGEVRTGGNIVDSFESAKNDQDFVDAAKEIAAGVSDTVTTIPAKFRLTRSMSVLNTRLLLCAGPIDSVSQIEIDERVVGDFPGLKHWVRKGEQHQQSVTGFDRVTKTVTLLLSVPQATPAEFTTTVEVEEIELIIRFKQGLYIITDDGFRPAHRIEMKVEYRIKDATQWIEAGQFFTHDFVINPFEYRIRIAPLVKTVYEVKVTRINADDPPGNVRFSAFEIFFVNETTYQNRNHPGVAYLTFSQLPGEQVSPINPTNYTAVVKGFNDIRQYTSDTQFTTAWTDNPAWCCGHFLTSKHNGMGSVFDWTDIDIPSFLLWADYCDELVEDGRVALEKRATFNRIFDSRTSAKSILEDFTAGSGVSVIFKGAKFRVIIDEPRPLTHIFSEGNVHEGKIGRAYFPKSELPTRISIQFRNLENNWEIDTVMEEDPDVKLGLFQNSRTFRMLHITRPGQAAREAMRIVRTNTLITQGVEFTAGLQAASLSVGDRIGISSIGVGIGLGSGQITSVASDDLTMHLDDDITFEAGKTYQISVTHTNDGIIDTVPLVHPGTGVTTNIVVATEKPWRRALQAGDTYAIGETNSVIREYRVDSVEVSGFGEKLRVKVRAGLYDEKVFDLTPVSNQFVAANERPHRDSVPGPVKNLKVVFSAAEPRSRVGRRAQRSLEVSWDPPESFSIDHYEIVYRENDNGDDFSSWQIAGNTKGNYFSISENIFPNTQYHVAVLSVSPGGQRRSIETSAGVKLGTGE